MAAAVPSPTQRSAFMVAWAGDAMEDCCACVAGIVGTLGSAVTGAVGETLGVAGIVVCTAGVCGTVSGARASCALSALGNDPEGGAARLEPARGIGRMYASTPPTTVAA